MAINFPTSLDTLTNPTASDKQNSPSHATQHANANDILEALEAKVGITSSAVTTTLDYYVEQAKKGWTFLAAAGTRVSNTQMTISGDVTAYLAVGLPIKLTDTTTKYYYITSFSYGAPNTTVNFTGGTDYVLVGNATNIFYGSSPAPVGFPQYFNYTPTFTGFTATIPSAYISQFSISNRIVTWFFQTDTGGTSNANTFTMTLPVTALTLTNGAWFCSALGVDNGNNNAAGTPGFGVILTGGTTMSLYKDYNYATWTTSGAKRAKFTAIYPI